MVLAEGHPYLTLAVLAVGALANELVSFIKDKENKGNTGTNDNSPD